MKKNISIVCSMILLAGSLMMTGCSTDRHSTVAKEKPQSVSMVLGIHKFFPRIPMNTESLSEKVYDACYSYGDCSAVVVDGEPFLACDYNIKKPDKKIDETKRKQLAEKSRKQILLGISEAKAETPEIDLLSSIELSSQALKGSGGSQKTMLVFDSGLSTCPPLDFSQANVIDAPADVIVEQLENMHAIPDLYGIDIVWSGMGTTCGEQEKLTSDYKYKLQTLWEAILTAGGASSVTFDPSPLPNKEYDGDLPECTVVPVISGSLDLSEASADQNLPEVIKFDESTSVKFKGDLSEFVDKHAAVEALTPVAEYLVQNPDRKIYIAGMTATVQSPDAGKALSLQRAKACEAVLLNGGVDAGQILCVGLGHTPNLLRVQDLDDQGNLIEEMAQLNRAVFFIREDSVLVNTILEI